MQNHQSIYVLLEWGLPVYPSAPLVPNSEQEKSLTFSISYIFNIYSFVFLFLCMCVYDMSVHVCVSGDILGCQSSPSTFCCVLQTSQSESCVGISCHHLSSCFRMLELQSCTTLFSFCVESKLRSLSLQSTCCSLFSHLPISPTSVLKLSIHRR